MELMPIDSIKIKSSYLRVETNIEKLKKQFLKQYENLSEDVFIDNENHVP